MRATSVLLAVLPLLVMSGCGGPDNRAEVSGSISFNGQPLASGSISFVPAEGNKGPSSGGSIVDGRYSVPRAKGVALGKNRVSILSPVKTGRKIEFGGGRVEDEWVQSIPAKYNEQSELVREIQPGSNRLDFELYAK
jgi:hypothetical protein